MINIGSIVSRSLLLLLVLFHEQRYCSSQWNVRLGLVFAMESSSPSPPSMILRIRRPNGKVTHLQIKNPNESTIRGIASSILENGENVNKDDAHNDVTAEGNKFTLGIPTGVSLDGNKPISELNLKNGAMICCVNDNNNNTSKKSSGQRKIIEEKDVFDPFPDLAKPRYTSAARKARAMANLKRGMTFNDISKLSSSMHTVQAQENGKIKRVYLCSNSIPTFQSSSFDKKQQRVTPKIALLFGTYGSERVEPEQSKKKARTSLSSQSEDTKFCDIVKVQTIWEIPSQKPSTEHAYDWSCVESSLMNENGDKEKNDVVEQAIRLASKLNLHIVGWIYSHNGGNEREESKVPVLGRDVIIASKIQCRIMQHCKEKDGGHEEWKGFVTCAMDVLSGATEVYQISDQVVQMVSEGILLTGPAEGEGHTKNNNRNRYVSTSDPVVVDGKEVREVDSLLCLVNTALLSHKGSFSSGRSNGGNKLTGLVKASTGNLTTKGRKQLISALQLSNNDSSSQFMDLLLDFNLLFGISKLLAAADAEQLAKLVFKFSRGQKKSSVLGGQLKLSLESLLGLS